MEREQHIAVLKTLILQSEKTLVELKMTLGQLEERRMESEQKHKEGKKDFSKASNQP